MGLKSRWFSPVNWRASSQRERIRSGTKLAFSYWDIYCHRYQRKFIPYQQLANRSLVGIRAVSTHLKLIFESSCEPLPESLLKLSPMSSSRPSSRSSTSSSSRTHLRSHLQNHLRNHSRYVPALEADDISHLFLRVVSHPYDSITQIIGPVHTYIGTLNDSIVQIATNCLSFEAWYLNDLISRHLS